MIFLDGSSLTIEQLLAVADRSETVVLADAARDRVRASRTVVDARAVRQQVRRALRTASALPPGPVPVPARRSRNFSSIAPERSSAV